MSRFQAGALSVVRAAGRLGRGGPRALDDLGPAGPVWSDVPDELPLVLADPGLLERVLAT